MTIAPIITARLELHAVLPEEFELLAVDRADPRLWVDRGFANPHRHLVDDPGPLHYRIPRIRTEPHGAPFFLRMAVLRAERAIIGSAGFHLLPDESGMIEIGYGIEAGLMSVTGRTPRRWGGVAAVVAPVRPGRRQRRAIR